MDIIASRTLRRSLVGALALCGCVTVPSPGSRRLDGPTARFQQIRDSIARARSFEEADGTTAPRIRLVVLPATYASTPYVDASFHLSEDAYVLIVAVDLDRRVRVLYPETPEQRGFTAKSNSNRLTRFFAGFGGPRGRSYASYGARYDITQRISPVDGGGVLLAIASERPLQLERLIDENGDWDEHALSQLIFDRTMASAAHAVGRAVVLTGQEYDTDVTTFGGSPTLGAYSSFASSRFDDCADEYGGLDAFGFSGSRAGSSYSGPVTRFVGLYRRGDQTYARYASGGGSCGRSVYYDVAVNTPRVAPRDTTRRDSTRVARRRPRFPGAPRFPSVSEDSGTRPLARRLAPPDANDAAPERPLVAPGLRFRPPDQSPTERLRPLDTHSSPREVEESPARRHPWSAGDQATRPTAPRAEGSEPLRPADRPQPPERREEPRAEPAHPEPARREPVRSEPVRSEPVRSEPVRSEPVRSAPVQREPVPVAPAPITPR